MIFRASRAGISKSSKNASTTEISATQNAPVSKVRNPSWIWGKRRYFHTTSCHTANRKNEKTGLGGRARATISIGTYIRTSMNAR
ncbi:MAG: hypothetical protein Ct9H300mP16_02200 [Pseudomonadota bacterium]|nr:MAG: hypothetical protein Ct9H300mP16_02200 [Pseudomonadota bacterium]